MEIAGLLVLLSLWIVTFLKYHELLVSMPLAEGAGSKGARGWIFFLPILGSVSYCGMTILNKYPHVFNYPTKITPQNAEKKYRVATRLIRYLKFVLVLSFSLVAWMSSPMANISPSGLVPWFLLLFVGLIFGPLAYAIFRLFRTLYN
jgi:hypothetical protein